MHELVAADPVVIFNYVFGAVGVLGTIFGAYAIWQTRQSPARLRYNFRRAIVVAPTRDKRVGHTFGGRQVPRVSKLSIGFVNAGRQRINQGDIERPVTVQLDEGAEILNVEGDAKVVGPHTVEVDVCPLAPGEHRLATLHHTGPQDVEATVSGQVANLPRGLEGPWGKPNTWRDPWAIGLMVVMLGAWVALGVALFNSEDTEGWNLVARLAYAIFLVPGTLLAGLLLLVLLIQISSPVGRVLRRVFRPRSPFRE
jgi:hypothetical protein